MTDVTENQKLTTKNKGFSKACLYFKKGFCGYGEKCTYRHTQSKGSSRQNCQFYSKASCKFASKCWYKHIRPNGKICPKPDQFNKFIVVGPSGEEPDEIEETQTLVEDSDAPTAVLAQETEIHRSFKRPQNQDNVPKNCFYYEKKGACYYGDKCWYSHSEPYAAHPTNELPYEAHLEPAPELEPDPDHNKMCYNFIFKECEFGDECAYVHGDICQFCDLAFLHPFDERQRNDHLRACETFFLEDMDNAFKFMISKDKMCSICLEYVWNSDKAFTKQKFGIHEDCNHIFCLSCIRKWRDVNRKSAKNEATARPHLCPACRKESLVIVPCARWFESDEEKTRWVKDYKNAIARKPCKFYAKGKCAGKDKCQYLHSEFVPLARQMQGEEGNWPDLESNYQDVGWPIVQELRTGTTTEDQNNAATIDGNWGDLVSNYQSLSDEQVAMWLAEQEFRARRLLEDQNNATTVRGNREVSEFNNQLPSGEQARWPTAQVHGYWPGTTPEDRYNAATLQGYSENSESNNQLPSGVHDVECQATQIHESLVGTTSDHQNNVGLDLQSGEQGISGNLADEHQLDDSLGQVNTADNSDGQDIERKNRRDPGIFNHTPANQSSEHINPNSLTETTAQQFDENSNRVDVEDVYEN